MARSAGVSGVAVGMAAAGGLLVWAGLNNTPLLEAVRDLARGKAPTPHRKPGFEPVVGGQVGAVLGGVGAAVAADIAGGTGAAIVAKAMEHKGRHPYVYGGGHGSWSCGAGRGLDCSGFASCVLHELGLLASPKNTTAFLAWAGAVTVPWEQRAAGDLIIWPQHMGIAVSPSQMIHTGGSAGCPCVVPYSQMRAGRKGVARRVRAADPSAPPRRRTSTAGL